MSQRKQSRFTVLKSHVFPLMIPVITQVGIRYKVGHLVKSEDISPGPSCLRMKAAAFQSWSQGDNIPQTQLQWGKDWLNPLDPFPEFCSTPSMYLQNGVLFYAVQKGGQDHLLSILGQTMKNSIFSSFMSFSFTPNGGMLRNPIVVIQIQAFD